MLIFLYDSPFYNLKKGRIEEARKCLKLYHCSEEIIESKIKKLNFENAQTYNLCSLNCSKISAKNNGLFQLLKSS